MNVFTDVWHVAVGFLAVLGAAGLIAAVVTARKTARNSDGTVVKETIRPDPPTTESFKWDEATVTMVVPATWNRGGCAWSFEMGLEDFCQWVAGIQREHENEGDGGEAAILQIFNSKRGK